MHKRFVYALAGLQTGVTGGVAILIWLMVASLWTHHSLWYSTNLLASPLLGVSAFRERLGLPTAAGGASVLSIYGAIGIMFGLLLGDRRASFRLLCFSLIVALAAYWATNRYWTYAPRVQMFWAHVLFGFVLAGYPIVERRLRVLAQPYF